MLNRFLLGRNIYLVSNILKNTIGNKSTMASTVAEMPRAVVRIRDDEDYFTLHFNYTDPTVSTKEKKYNLHRKKGEELSALKARILCNIDKKLSRKKQRQQKKFAKSASPDADPQQNAYEDSIEVNLFINGTSVSDETTNIEAFKPGAILEIGQQKYEIIVNPPMVTKLNLPRNIMAGFPVYPKYDVEFAHKSACYFEWFRSSNVVYNDRSPSNPPIGQLVEVEGDPKLQLHPVKSWDKVCDNKMSYVTSQYDIGRKLKVICVPKCGDVTGEPLEAESRVIVTPSPGVCPFENRHLHTQQLTPPNSFRVVSYNILADLYADSDFTRNVLFPYCPPYALEIDYRKQLILKEILGYNADLLCMQEVDKKLYISDLEPAMSNEGFDSVFNLKGGQVVEGLACIYRKSKFRCLESHSIILADALQSNPIYSKLFNIISQNERLKDRIIQRTTALQALVLESTENKGNIVCVLNTHLYFKPDADHIRILQAYMCILYMEQLVALTAAKHGASKVALLLCGDFNSSPENAVHQFMTTQFVPEDSADWISNEEEAVKGLSISHRFNLSSGCGIPDFTNYTEGFVSCIDYIFYDTSNFKVEKVVPMPTLEEVRQHRALPSVTMPSDHISLVCDLSWK